MGKVAAAVLLAGISAPVFGGENNLIFLTSIPTLDEVGLGALIALVTAAAGWAVRWRNRK